MAELSRTQSAKQGARNLMHKASDKMRVAGSKLGGGDFKDLDIAIVKATTCNFHVVPKEKHVRTLKAAVHSSRPRRDVTYVVTELHKRLQSSTDWLTALKTLVTIHRLMRETEVLFLEEMVKLGAHLTHGKGRLLNMENFIDRTNIEGRFDFSEWVRAYGKYLDEQLETYGVISWYVEQEQPGAQSRLRSLGARDLLYQLPFLQRLQRRLLDCVPKGQTARDPVVLHSLGLVVKESFALYKAVSEGIINLADSFFEMDYLDAVKGLELYKESIASNEALANYYATIEQIEEVKRAMQLPKLAAPPLDFVKSMEQYISEAPRPADAEAHKKSAPLRKGRMLHPGKRTGPSAGAEAAAAAAKDPGMVLPVGLPPSTPASPGSPAQTASPGTATAAAGSGAVDLLGFGDLAISEPALGSASPSAAAAAAGPAKKPTPLDLLSDLDFSYPIEQPAPAPAYATPAAAAPSSSNPFAALPQPQPAAATYGGAGAYQSYSYGTAASAPGVAPFPPQPYPGAAAYPGAPGAGQAFPAYAQPPPSPGFAAADFGAPSPPAAAAHLAASPGGYDSLRSSGGNPLRASSSGFSGTPGRSPSNNVDLFRAAGAHDPFASLTGLGGSVATAGTPGSTKTSPAKPSPAARASPSSSAGNLFSL